VTTEVETPDGYHWITPYFTVDEGDKLIAFLTAAFDAAVIKDNRYDNGRIQHARLRIGDSVIMLNESAPDYPANTSQMHLYVANTDSAYARALELGGTSLMEPNDRPHGDRMAGISDPCGNVWWLATHNPQAQDARVTQLRPASGFHNPSDKPFHRSSHP
jgi:uncharacterized glyoxalase superfamily protein PhnB